ncbi:hypothetical protein PROFUN_02277 [Planoprotostelium fungivorum]|uniref:Uncharacterized protein n=1 Tax=Planoprotostelium fungivorum TaxID=1890364 RepID=A0A2P6NYH9_9EUKA|nr:hypothetical protein PROFUN_02277 [Planoprotostelium fungivorum]
MEVNYHFHLRSLENHDVVQVSANHSGVFCLILDCMQVIKTLRREADILHYIHGLRSEMSDANVAMADQKQTIWHPFVAVPRDEEAQPGLEIAFICHNAPCGLSNLQYYEKPAHRRSGSAFYQFRAAIDMPRPRYVQDRTLADHFDRPMP